MLAKAYIEITTFCGLNCDFCEPKKSPPAQIELALFDKINKELLGKTRSLAYHILGDPLSVQNLNAYLDISAFYGHKVEIVTSGHYLKNIDKNTLLHKAIKQINFSISSFFSNKNTAINLEEYLSEIIEFCKFSAANPKRFVNLRLWNLGDKNYAAFNEDVEKILEAKLSKPIYVNNKGKIAPYTIVVKDKMFEWPNIQKQPLYKNGTCHAITSQLGFLVDGRVIPCCLDASGNMSLGDANYEAISDVVTSKKATTMIDGFRNGVLVEKMCQTCGFRQVRL